MASAPKAEVGLSGSSLLAGRVRPRLNLVGAELSVRIGVDGQFTLLTTSEKNADRKPVPAGSPPPEAAAAGAPSKTFLRDAPKHFNAFLAWIDSLRTALGLDGGDLDEIGLKNGRVVVDDQRSGSSAGPSSTSISA